MNRFIVYLFTLFCMSLQMGAQNLSEAEVTSRMTQALELEKAGKTAEALELFLAVGEHTKLQRSEEERQAYVRSQTMVCECYEQLGQYEEGFQLAKRMLEGQINDSEREDLLQHYVLSGYVYACNCIQGEKAGREDFKRGREIITEILPYADSLIYEKASLRIPYSWYFDGVHCESTSQYEEALTSYEHASKGFGDLGRVSEVIAVLHATANVNKILNRYAEEEEAYSKAFVLAQHIGDTARQMSALKELWTLGSNTGNLRLAHAASASMDSLVEVSGDAMMKFNYYQQKGEEAATKGQYVLAEKWYTKSKELAEDKNLALEPNCKHLVYSSLRDLHLDMKQFDEAIAYGRLAIEEFQSTRHPEESTYHLPYGMLAEVYRIKGDKENCFACVDSMFLDERYITDPRELSRLYVLRAHCHDTFNGYDTALADYKKADEILASKYPLTEPYRTLILALIGELEHQLGQHDASEDHYRLYAETIKQQYGERTLDYIKALILLANAEGCANHLDAGCKDYTDAATKLKEMLRAHVPYMSTEEREAFWSPVSTLFTTMTPYAIKAGRTQDAFTESCYDALVMTKAFLLESERSLHDVVKKEGTDEDMKDYTQLALMKKKIKEWEKDYAQYTDSILHLSQQADRLAVRLAERCRSFSDITGFMDIDYAAVKQALKPTDVLLDFTDYVTEANGREYAVYVIGKKDSHPLLKYLFAESRIDSLGITRPDMYYHPDYAPEVLKLLWEPLKANITEGSTVYYVPSQLLFQMSLESLPLADGSLLGNHYRFVRLSSARELVNGASSALSDGKRTAVLYGGMQYDLDSTTMAEEAKKYDLAELTLMRGDRVRGDSVFVPLPGTRQEVMQIASMLKTHKWQVTTQTDMEGTEESFLSMHGKSPKVLHMATHAFYYTPEGAEAIDYLKGYSDAMMLSGIVLSGGNAAWLGKALPEGVLGGILTANNIAHLDLKGTEMVVLSACQSGQGKATSEGLYGLQRAFKKAGAGTMVMALWSVSDKVTTEFMTTFYEQLASRPCRWDKRKAFEKAKSIIRDKYPDPFHWAAFVMLD